MEMRNCTWIWLHIKEWFGNEAAADELKRFKAQYRYEFDEAYRKHVSNPMAFPEP